MAVIVLQSRSSRSGGGGGAGLDSGLGPSPDEIEFRDGVFRCFPALEVLR